MIGNNSETIHNQAHKFSRIKSSISITATLALEGGRETYPIVVLEPVKGANIVDGYALSMV